MMNISTNYSSPFNSISWRYKLNFIILSLILSLKFWILETDIWSQIYKSSSLSAFLVSEIKIHYFTSFGRIDSKISCQLLVGEWYIAYLYVDIIILCHKRCHLFLLFHRNSVKILCYRLQNNYFVQRKSYFTYLLLFLILLPVHICLSACKWTLFDQWSTNVRCLIGELNLEPCTPYSYALVTEPTCHATESVSYFRENYILYYIFHYYLC